MLKVIKGKSIHFYDDENNEVMYIDYSFDECIWYFCSNNVVNVAVGTELYDLLDSVMSQDYMFGSDELSGYKDENKLVWYSDCYYDPDDEWSVANVSCLNIERKSSGFDIWCTKKIDEMIKRKNKTYVVSFSPLGNGKYSRNLNNGLTLQDDFVSCVYHPLLEKNKVLKK